VIEDQGEKRTRAKENGEWKEEEKEKEDVGGQRARLSRVKLHN
jgi:hypothetical protein